MESLRDRILAARDKQTKPVFVEEWNETIYVKSWSGGERSKFFALSQEVTKKPEKLGEFNAKTLIMSLVNEQGESIFKESDVHGLLERNGSVIEKLIRDILDFNGVFEKN